MQCVSTVEPSVTVSNLHFINDDLYAVNPDGVYRLDGDNWTEIYSYVDARINCLAGLDSDIVLGGTFSRVAGVDALRVAVWDGMNWHALGGGFDGNIGQATLVRWDGVDWEVIAKGSYQYSSIEDVVADGNRVLVAGSQWYCPEFGQDYGNVRVGEIASE